MSAARFAAKAVALSAAAAFAVPIASAAAAAGDPDPTFGDAGRRHLSVGAPVAVLVQPDGKTVVVGDGQFSFLKGFIVTRLNVDGSPDRSFDGDGTAVAFASDGVPAGAALQADGKLVVAGASGTTMAVARFDTNGSLDPSFSPGGTDGDGKIVIPGQSPAGGVVIQEDGLITLITSRQGATTQDLSVVRVSENGVPDLTKWDLADFGGDDSPVAAASVPDEAVVVLGRASDAGGPVAAVARYTLDGKLDKDFAGTGKVKIPAIAEPKSVLVTPQGKIVVTGTSGGDEPRTVVARLDDKGAADNGFGRKGVASVDFDGEDNAAGAALAPDGKLLVAGTGYLDADFSAARLTAAGAVDPSYGKGGFARAPVADVYALGSTAALSGDGRFVIAGLAVMSGPIARTAITRLAGDSSPRAQSQPPQPQPPPQPQLQAQSQADPAAAGPVAAEQPKAKSETLTRLDAQAPDLRGLRLTAPYVRFTLSKAARVRFTLERARSGGRYRSLGASFAASGVAGANRVRLAERLKAGRYRLTATATDASGNAGRAQHVSFTVKKGRR